jgi:hypothetical protein
MAGSISYITVVPVDIAEGAEFYDGDELANAITLGEDKYISEDNYNAAKTLTVEMTSMLRALGYLPADKKLEIVSGN